MTETKQCKKCQIDKPLDKFRFKNNENKGTRVCRQCDNRKGHLLAKAKEKAVRAYIASLEGDHTPEELKEHRKAAIEQFNALKPKKDCKKGVKWQTATRLRSCFRAFLKGYTNSSFVNELVGCTRENLISHLEAQFLLGMTWENYGRHGWHIDHIKPCAFFDLSDINQAKECFNYQNLQPLWALDNHRKGFLLQEYELMVVK
jgi:hypothetical protein